MFIPINVDVSGVMAGLFNFIANFICYGLIDWLMHYPVKAVITVVFTSCAHFGGG